MSDIMYHSRVVVIPTITCRSVPDIRYQYQPLSRSKLIKKNLINVDFTDSQPDVKNKLENVVYSSRYALALFYNPGTILNYSWGAKYFDDHCIRFVSIDDKKRGAGLSADHIIVCIKKLWCVNLNRINNFCDDL